MHPSLRTKVRRGNKIEEEEVKEVYTPSYLFVFMMSNILFVSEKEKPKNQSKERKWLLAC